jgi:hypothetical protein
MLTKLFTYDSFDELIASLKVIEQWRQRNDAKVSSVSVTVSYQTDLGLLPEDDEQLVGVYRGLEDLDPEDDGLKLV